MRKETGDFLLLPRDKGDKEKRYKGNHENLINLICIHIRRQGKVELMAEEDKKRKGKKEKWEIRG